MKNAGLTSFVALLCYLLLPGVASAQAPTITMDAGLPSAAVPGQDPNAWETTTGGTVTTPGNWRCSQIKSSITKVVNGQLVELGSITTPTPGGNWNHKIPAMNLPANGGTLLVRGDFNTPAGDTAQKTLTYTFAYSVQQGKWIFTPVN